MSTDPVTLSPDVSIDEAFELLERCGIRHLPVAEGEQVLGIVSERDLATAIEELGTRGLTLSARAAPVAGPGRRAGPAT